MILADILSVAYVAYGTVRGGRRGLGDEAFRLFRLAIAFAAGCGLHKLVGNGIGRLLSIGSDVSAPVAFAVTVAGAWWLLRRARIVFAAWAEKRLGRHARLGGAIAGGLRSALLALSIAATINMAGHVPGGDAVRRGSWVGRLAGWVLQTK